MDRVFLDANVLFSAVYQTGAGLAKLWKIDNAKLITSTYALAEAHINLDQDIQKQRLDRLAKQVELLGEQVDNMNLPEHVVLPDKDKPILQAAIRAQSSHLLTGDFRHFGPYYDQTIQGVLIQTPSAYLRRNKDG